MGRYKTSTVNSYIISVNRYISWLGYNELKVKTIRSQHRDNLENVVSLPEYRRLLQYCINSGRYRDYLLLRTIASTGIRVGELKYITYESAVSRSAEVYSKGKSRMVLITGELSNLLLDYCEERKIFGGVIFRGRNKDCALTPKSVWKLLKGIAEKADVDRQKVYPHSLRHLFAKMYMQKVGNVLELADLLGHANIETTRIYTVSSREEKRESLNSLGL